MWQLLSLIGALLIGYGIRYLPIRQNTLNQVLFYIVVLILFVMGYEFGSTNTDLWVKLASISKNVLVFSTLLFISNLIMSHIVLHKTNHNLRITAHVTGQINYIQLVLQSGKYVLIIAIGIISGFMFKKPFTALPQFIGGLLFILLFIVGHQIRAGGVALKHVLFNRTGILLTVIIIVSSFIAGILAAFIVGMPIVHGLMLCSGFGWYTLASILNGQLVSQQFGTTSFFIDFTRELLAIILMPSLGRYFPVSMVGYCGCTGADFALPIIKQNLHEKCVLLAISSGMLLSTSVPILISLLAKL